MPAVTMRELLEAGVHFGHQTRRWNPKMRRFIFSERSGIYVIDLQQTIELIETAHSFVRNVAERGGSVLFVGTKKQAQDSIRDEADPRRHAVRQPPLARRPADEPPHRSRAASTRMHDLRRLRADGQLDLLPPKERMSILRELEKLETNLGGVADMRRLPQAVFVIDLKKEALAIREARRCNIPVIGLVDTNCDPDEATFVIPGNDDAIRSCGVVIRVLADGIAEGQGVARAAAAEIAAAAEAEALAAEEAAAAAAAEAEAAAAAAAAAEAAEPGDAAETRRARGLTDPLPETFRMSDYTPSAAEVKVLREATSAGMMDCKRALVETAGDHDAAVTLLRERGIAKQATRADRIDQGRRRRRLHPRQRAHRRARRDRLRDRLRREHAELPRVRARGRAADQRAARRPAGSGARTCRPSSSRPRSTSTRRRPPTSPSRCSERIAEGKLGKWYEGVVLLEQPWIRDGDRTIEQLRAELSVATGENVEIKRFARFERGA